MSSQSNTNSANSFAKSRATSRRAFMMPAALQPDAILEAANAVDANTGATPQRVNQPVVAVEVAASSKKIDEGSTCSADSEATSAVTPVDMNTLRNARRNLRVSTSTTPTAHATTPTAAAAVLSHPATPTISPTSAKLMQRQREVMDELNRHNSNLFVRNLSLDVDQAELDEVFSAYGTILSSAVMRNIHTGESLGTGFVRFSTHEEAARAMEALHNSPIKSRAICIQWAKRHDGAPVGDARKKIMKLFVRNIPLDCSVEVLEELFGRYGCVRQVTLHKDTAPVEDPAMERLIAFVIYTEEGAAERAATAVHNTKPFLSCNGIPVMIKLAEDQVRHDRARQQRRSQPVSPQHNDQQQLLQQVQQQGVQQCQPQPSMQPQSRFLAEHPEEVFDVAAFFESMFVFPQSPATTTDFNSNCPGVCPVVMPSPFDFQPSNTTYFPPSALVPNTAAAAAAGGTMMVLNGRPCLSPTCTVPMNDCVYAACGAPVLCSPQPVLCSPLTSPLSVNVAASVGPASVHNSSFAGSTANGDCQRAAGLMATPTCGQPHASSNASHRSTPDGSIGSGSGRGVMPIPNPRSANREAVAGQRRQDGEAQPLHPVLSPCPSFECPSLPLSPAVVVDGRGVVLLQSPPKYRHNPYSLFSSAFAC